MSKDRKLYRSRSNKILCGVLGGLGDYFNVDPTVLRVAYVLLSVFVLGSPIILYIICRLINPAGRLSSRSSSPRISRLIISPVTTTKIIKN